MNPQVDDYELGRTLGAGATSIVTVARKADSDTLYAMKVFDLEGSEPIKRQIPQRIRQEIKIQSQMNNDRITKILNYNRNATLRNHAGDTKSVAYIVTELAPYS